MKTDLYDDPEYLELKRTCPVLPDISPLRIPMLLKSKADKKKLLHDLVKSVEKNKKHDISNLLSYLTVGFQRLMESTYFEKVHHLVRVEQLADTAKQRTVLRKKAFACNSIIKTLVTSYNSIAIDLVLVDDVLRGVFEWKVKLFTQAYPPEFTDVTKRAVLESFTKKKRCEEELVILEQDMTKYLRYYGNICLELEQQIKDTETSKTGMLILLRDGYLFAQNKLHLGLELFQPFVPVISSLEQSNNSPSDDDDDDDDYDDDEGDVNNDNDIDADNEENEDVFLDLELILFTGNELLEGKSFSHTENTIQFPRDVCQSHLNGRNGSNACTTIALLVGHFLYDLVCGNSLQKIDVLKAFVGCIDFGNFYHGEQYGTTVVESMDLLPISFYIEKELNCTATELFMVLNRIDTQSFVVITDNNEKSFCCIPFDDFFYFFDSHVHGDYGALVVQHSKNKNFQNFNFFSDSNEFYVCIISS
ncbi:uncharacterized protein [Clytia hemisphaerica]|uniref:uncharacterized protein n=1 Tax=Clytia hemisphaerica TaxID=252671 RepID=UPI0034D6CFFF